MKSLTIFLTTNMKMTSFYQPIIIQALLDGITDNTKIAELCHNFDPKFSVQDYSKKLKIHPKTVLKKHGIALCEQGKWSLTCEASESDREITRLKLVEYQLKHNL